MKPSTAELAASLKLDPTTATSCDQVINPLLELLREGKVDDVQTAIAAIDDDTVHTVGRRTCERWVGYMQSGFAIGAMALMAGAYSADTSQTIVRSHTSEKDLLSQLESMFMADYRRREADLRAKIDLRAKVD